MFVRIISPYPQGLNIFSSYADFAIGYPGDKEVISGSDITLYFVLQSNWDRHEDDLLGIR